MSGLAAGWSVTELAGHACDIYEPRNRNQHGYVVIYLHGVHQARLHENAAFTAEFERHGLMAMAPHTGPSWWTDKICRQFDRQLSAEQHVLRNVVPYAAERWGSTSPRLALLGTSMGGQGALRLAFKHPRTFPFVAAMSPAIDYQIRFDDPDAESLRRCIPTPRAPGRIRRRCTFIRSTGHATPGSVATRSITAGMPAPTGCT